MPTVHFISHEGTLASVHLTSVVGLHHSFKWLTSWLAVFIVNMVPMSTKVQKPPRADGALISNHKFLIVMWRDIPDEALLHVTFKGVLIELLFARKYFWATAALKNSICWDVCPVVLQVFLDLDWFNEEFPAASYLADELCFHL